MRRMKIRRVFSLIVPAGFLPGMLLPWCLHAESTVRGLSMAGAYTALSRGVEAPAWNPANLGLSDNPGFSLTIFSTTVGAGNNSFNLNDIETYQGRHWSAKENQEILGRIPDEGFNLLGTVAVQTLSFSTGRMAFTLELAADARARLDRTVFALILNGNELDKDYTFDRTGAMGTALASAAFSFGVPLDMDFADDFAVGMTFRYIQGLAHAHLDSVSSRFRTDLTRGILIDGSFDAVSALGGSGFGMDFGAAVRTETGWSAGVSFQNLFTEIYWNRGIKRTFGYFRGDSIWVLNPKDDAEESAFEDSICTEEGIPFLEGLPVVMRLGVAYERGRLVFSADYRQGFAEGSFATKRPRFSLGLEWHGIRWLPLRMGMVLGGRSGFGTALGLGIHPGSFMLDVGLLNRGLFFPKTMKGLTLGVNLAYFSDHPAKKP
ncbi:MAG TPA: hypothetical protein ENN17_09850 [bacterium]|nr:hypothetical protein [bacterium]